MELPVCDPESVEGESAALDFKAEFDGSKQAWCELVKDVVAMANSGGGCIFIGVTGDGAPSGHDISAVLKIDGADITNHAAGAHAARPR